MNVKRYSVKSDTSDLEVVMDVDHDILTPELAHEINRFWTDADARLAECDEDPVQAVIRLAALNLQGFVLDGFVDDACIDELHEQEGWPPKGQLGISLVDIYVPKEEFNYLRVDLVEVAARG